MPTNAFIMGSLFSLGKNICESLCLCLQCTENGEYERLSELRHSLVEDFLETYGFLIGLLPFLFMLVIVRYDNLLGLWGAWGASLFLNFLDYYRSRYHPKVLFPIILNVGALLGFTANIVLAYVYPDDVDSPYSGPITFSFIFAAGVLSMLFCYPFTFQMTAFLVNEEVRKSKRFLDFNMKLTAFVNAWFTVILICLWLATFLPVDSIAHILLGSIIPLIASPLIFASTRRFAIWLRGNTPTQSSVEDEEQGYQRIIENPIENRE